MTISKRTILILISGILAAGFIFAIGFILRNKTKPETQSLDTNTSRDFPRNDNLSKADARTMGQDNINNDNFSGDVKNKDSANKAINDIDNLMNSANKDDF